MRILGPVVQIPMLPVLDPGHQLPLGRAVTRQLVRDQNARRPHLLLQQLAKQAPGGPLVSPTLDQDVEHDPMLVDGPPQPVLLAADPQTHFVQVPLVSRTGQPTPDLVGEVLAELARPLAHGLMADEDAAGGQHLFDHAQAQGKAEIEPDSVADDLGWEAMTGIAVTGGCRHPARLPAVQPGSKPLAANLTVPARSRANAAMCR